MARRCLSLPIASVVVLAAVAAAQSEPPAGARSPRGLASALPAETVVFVETTDLGGCLDALRRGLGVTIAELPPQARGMLSAVAAGVRTWSGESAEDLLAALRGAPLALAVVAADGGLFPVALARLADAELGARLERRLGAKAAVSWRHGVLAVAQRPEQLSVLAAARDSGRTLAARADFARDRPPLPHAGLRYHVDVARLRGERPPLWQRTRGGQRLLFGPIAQVLDRARCFDGTLRGTAAGVELDGALDASPLGAPASLLLQHGGEARTLPPLPSAALGTLSLDRSLLGFLSHLDELLDGAAAAQVRASLSIIDTLLGGASLVGDLLPQVVEPLTLVALAQEPAADPPPRVRLPGFALVAEQRSDGAHQLLARAARAAFLINTGERLQRGQHPFRLRRDRIGGAVALVIEPDEWRGEGDPPIEYNLAITLVATQRHVVLATTREAAARVVAALAAGAPAVRVSGDLVEVAGEQLAQVLAQHEDLLALNAVLEEGKTLAEAKSDLQLVEFVLRRLGRIELGVVPEANRTRLRVRLTGAVR